MKPAVSQMPLVVVGIATKNRAGPLRKAILSVLEQSYQPLRVMVVDDASSDETPSLRQEFEDVVWERWEQNKGLLRARNWMMLSETADYYVSLDDDAWFLEGDEIVLAVTFLEKHPEVAAVAFDILSPDNPIKRARGSALSVATFIGCGHVLRLSNVQELGGYAEMPASYGAEEKDLCLQLIDTGYEIVRLDGVHVWHDKTPMVRDVSRQHRAGVCNDLSFALRRMPVEMLAPALVWKIAKHISFALRHSLLRSCIQGFGDFALNAPQMWRSRCPVRRTTLARFRALSQFPRLRPAPLVKLRAELADHL